MDDVTMVVREVTDEDVMWWNRRGNDLAHKVAMRGDHIGAANIEVLRCRTSHDAPFEECWRVPFIVPDGDGTTYWFTMFTDGFPAVAAVAQPAGGSNGTS